VFSTLLNPIRKIGGILCEQPEFNHFPRNSTYEYISNPLNPVIVFTSPQYLHELHSKQQLQEG